MPIPNWFIVFGRIETCIELQHDCFTCINSMETPAPHMCSAYDHLKGPGCIRSMYINLYPYWRLSSQKATVKTICNKIFITSRSYLLAIQSTCCTENGRSAHQKQLSIAIISLKMVRTMIAQAQGVLFKVSYRVADSQP